MAQDRRLLAMKDACRYLGVSRMTLLEAEERGLIRPERTLGGHRRYTVEDLRALLSATQRRHEPQAPAAQPQGAFQLTQFIVDLHKRAHAPEGALKEALRNLVLLLQLEMGAVYLCDEGGALRLQAAYGIPHWFLPAMAEIGAAGVSGEALRQRRPQVYDGRSRHELPAQLEIGQGLCAPLIYQDEVLGCVHVLARREHQFFAGEINIVTTIAVYLASLVVNTQLLNQVQTHLRELSLLSQLSQAMEDTTDLEPLLELVLDESLRLVGEAVGTIHLSDEAGRSMFLRAGRGQIDWLHHLPVRTDVGIIGWMFQHLQPYYSPCLREDPLLPAEFVEGVRSLGTVSCLCLPMRTSAGLIGVVGINTARARTFSADEVRVLMTAAREAAVAIQRARLLAAAQRDAAEQRRLREAHARALDGLATPVAAVGALGAVTVWNAAFARLSGAPGELALGGDPRAVAPGLAPLWDGLGQAIDAGEERAVAVILPGGATARFVVRPTPCGGALIEGVPGATPTCPPAGCAPSAAGTPTP